MYRVECDTPNCLAGEQIRLVHVSTRAFNPRPFSGGTKLANLASASTFYISPSGELLFYATEHDNDGPSGTVKAGEWRHEDMVRDGSPTLLPSVDLDSPFEVDEGSSLTLTAQGRPPATKPWIQLFDDTVYDGFRVVVDYDDYTRDDFDALVRFEWGFPNVLGFHQRARSWRWFAPFGCTTLALDDEYFDDGVDPQQRTLAGAGVTLGHSDLALIVNDAGTGYMDKRTSAISFMPDCGTYYATPFAVRWDFDANGVFERSGTTTVFDATSLDGPFETSIPVLAEHPTGGPTAQATAVVKVRNVAPAIAGFTVRNAAGAQINVDVPFAVTGGPLRVSATFTDPGRADDQRATIDWGDGVVEPETAFATFADATDGAVGSVAHSHRYGAPGQVTIALTVTDDDEASDVESAVIRLLTPEQAVATIISMLDTVIAHPTDPEVRQALERARKSLVGNDGASNGVRDKLAEGNTVAAIAMLQQARDWLVKAQQLDADVKTLIALVEQVAVALAA